MPLSMPEGVAGGLPQQFFFAPLDGTQFDFPTAVPTPRMNPTRWRPRKSSERVRNAQRTYDDALDNLQLARRIGLTYYPSTQMTSDTASVSCDSLTTSSSTGSSFLERMAIERWVWATMNERPLQPANDHSYSLSKVVQMSAFPACLVAIMIWFFVDLSHFAVFYNPVSRNIVIPVRWLYKCLTGIVALAIFLILTQVSRGTVYAWTATPLVVGAEYVENLSAIAVCKLASLVWRSVSHGLLIFTGAVSSMFHVLKALVIGLLELLNRLFTSLIRLPLESLLFDIKLTVRRILRSKSFWIVTIIFFVTALTIKPDDAGPIVHPPNRPPADGYLGIHIAFQ